MGLLVLLLSCGRPEADSASLEGTYIGYYHRNQEDTAQVTLVFEGDYFAGKSKKHENKIEGSFQQKENSVIFFDSLKKVQASDSTLLLKGPYQYEVYDDGSIRLWKQYGDIMEEFILRQLLR